MRCDLHVHTIHSGMCTVPVARSFCRESYSDPEAVYRKLKFAGMDLVTVTDHDSIEAAEPLRKYPDFFISEEVTARMPSGTEVHIGVFDVSERNHLELQRRRNDWESLLNYLASERLLFSLNHMFSGLTGARDISDFGHFERVFPCVEILNGAMVRRGNRRAAEWAARMRKAPVGGSDAHTIDAAGCVYTVIDGARSKDEFLAGVRQGRGITRGTSGSYMKLTHDVLRICFQMVAERPWTVVLSPLFAGIPAYLVLNYWLEVARAERWFRRVAQRTEHPQANSAFTGEAVL
jgi:predicted metal-dependent phosphoesterase TrpH